MPHKKYYKHQGYLIVDRKPFLPIQQPLQGAPKVSSKPAIDKFLADLKKLDFQRLQCDKVVALTKKIQKDNLLIPMGSYGLIDYYLKCDVLRPRSLNASAHREGRAHVQELLQNLTFTNINRQLGAQSTRLVFPLGRLYASHHNERYFRQSRWVTVLDQTHLLWALYAEGIDDNDELPMKSGGKYNGAWDTAFGCNRAAAEKVVYLGSLRHIAFKEGVELQDVNIQPLLEWSTTLNDFDIRKPMMAPAIASRLLKIDTRLIEIPDPTSSKFKDLFRLCGYLEFCKQVQIANRPKGVIVGRTLMDAAWCKFITWFFKKSMEGRPTGLQTRQCVKAFNDAIQQVHIQSAHKYWNVRVKERNDLDNDTFLDDLSVENNIPLQSFLLGLINDFALPATAGRQASQSEDAMDVVDNEAAPATATEPMMSLEEADNKGLIKFIKKSRGVRESKRVKSAHRMETSSGFKVELPHRGKRKHDDDELGETGTERQLKKLKLGMNKE